MPLTLYQFQRSQFCEKVRIVLEMKTLEYEAVNVSWRDRTELIELSGQKKAPVLKDGGRVIVDSTDIVAYLDEKYPGSGPYPQQESDKAHALLVEDWADEALHPPIRTLVFEREDKSIRETAINELNSKLAYLNAMYASRTFLFGKLSIAEIAVFVQLRSFETLLNMEMDERFDALKAWYAGMKDLISAKTSRGKTEIPEPTG